MGFTAACLISQSMEIENLTLDADTPGQKFGLDIFRFHGSGNGPAVYIQGGLHSLEMPGTVAIDRLIPRLEAAEVDGCVVGDITLVPHANPVGLTQVVFGQSLGRFDANTRVNFNRSFPPKSASGLENKPVSERLKATLLALAEQAEVVLDLHCDDDGPVYLYVSERQLEEGRRLARSIGARVILTDASDDPISFDLAVGERWAADNRSERFAATVELRGMIDVTPEFAEHDANGLYHYLVSIGTVDDTLPANYAVDPIIGDVDAAELLATPSSGAVLYEVEICDWVKSGQRLAVVVSKPGAPHQEIISPFDGQVMTRREVRFVRKGDDVIKVLRHPLP